MSAALPATPAPSARGAPGPAGLLGRLGRLESLGGLGPLPALVATALVATSPAAAAEAPRHRVLPFEPDATISRALFVDIDGDRRQDLLVATSGELRLHRFRSGPGYDLAAPDGRLPLSGGAIAWDLDRGPDGRGLRVVLLVDGRDVLVAGIDPATGSIAPPTRALSGLSGFLPQGVHSIPFVRDVDGDGGADLVVPGLDRYQVHLRTPEGGWGPGLSVHLRTRLESRLDPGGDLVTRLGQSVTVPMLGLRDVNADGKEDLVAESEDSIDAYLARRGGGFPPEPSFSVDLAASRERVGRFDPDDVDFSNLTAAVRHTVQSLMQDVSGDRIEDLVLREGGKILLYHGAVDGLDLSRPRQVLRSGGNVVMVALHDEDEDGADDLWLVRIETISMADIFLWLVASGSVDFEVFIYRNLKGVFARRPGRKLTVTVEFPALRDLAGIGERIDEAKRDRESLSAAWASLDGASDREDSLLVLTGAELRAYLDVETDDDEETTILDLIGYSRDRDDYTVDVEEVADRILLAEQKVVARYRDRKPDLRIPVGAGYGGGDLAVLDLDGDGIDDALVLPPASEGISRGELLLSGRPEETNR